MTSEMSVSQINGKEIYLPDGRLLGVVGETVIDGSQLRATHIFVAGCPDELVEKRSSFDNSMALGTFNR